MHECFARFLPLISAGRLQVDQHVSNASGANAPEASECCDAPVVFTPTSKRRVTAPVKANTPRARRERAACSAAAARQLHDACRARALSDNIPAASRDRDLGFSSAAMTSNQPAPTQSAPLRKFEPAQDHHPAVSSPPPSQTPTSTFAVFHCRRLAGFAGGVVPIPWSRRRFCWR